ncbi:hypothetical protein C7974DRAFT_195769 [Boeremia exigua]|uniref:uncharacterized protein n=1 Tax=Boeremia exigua TaxID=749465 RepID=UPI001E8CD181|nr:uncharacterized protein C7974DRAFT_195769 [Boeremia exigua]KAH6625162.1 hypothetical protein C7974DRAFT_195769 [Boeremia exigua]
MATIGTAPKGYVMVSEAGRGVTARVYYCLPVPQVSFITSGRTVTITPDSFGFAGLKRSIVALKVSPSKSLITREDKALHAIRESTSPNATAMRRHFLDVKSVGTFTGLGANHSCAVLEAVIPPVTLGDLLQAFGGDVKAPIPLVYNLFLSLVPALSFLKGEVEWAHNDVKEDNIMCRTYEGRPFDLPEFVFVDFGMAYGVRGVKNDSGDCKNLLGLVRELAENAEESNDQQWLSFKRMLVGERNRTRWQVDDEFGKIWDSWKDIAEVARSKVKVGEVGRIDDMFEQVALMKKRITDEMVVHAARDGHVGMLVDWAS